MSIRFGVFNVCNRGSLMALPAKSADFMRLTRSPGNIAIACNVRVPLNRRTDDNLDVIAKLSPNDNAKQLH